MISFFRVFVTLFFRYDSGMKTIVLGAAGQLGRRFCEILPGSVVGLTRAEADLTQPAQLRSAFERHRPGIVVNAAGFTEVDRAEAEPALAYAVNADAVGELAALCREFDCLLVHFSTNYVYGADELRTTPYAECDAPGPINVYGKAKLLGEERLRAAWPWHFIIRTSGLYGLPGPDSRRGNFVDMMLRLARAGKPIRVVDDQICTPTSVVDLAEAVRMLLASNAYGTYHVTNAGACSWHAFARAIFDTSGQKPALVPIKSDVYAAAARRPRYSVLENARWIEAGFTPLRPWREALAEYLRDRHGG